MKNKFTLRLTSLLSAALLLLNACSLYQSTTGSGISPSTIVQTDPPITAPQFPDDSAIPIAPVTDPSQTDETYDFETVLTEALYALIQEMTPEEMVGQMFLIRCPASDQQTAIQTYHPGGLILFGRDFDDKTREEVIESIASYQAASSLPLLIAVDEEGGTVNRVSRNPLLRSTPFLSAQNLRNQGGMDAIINDTCEKADLLLSLGINVNMAPVCDVSQNPSDFIYPRAYGLDAQSTAEYVENVVQIMHQKGIGSVLKHFPGYGNNADTHTGIAYDNRSYDSFLQNDFLPFQAGIEAGADAVLVSHNIVACMDAEHPASLSPAVHEILRNSLQFDGVIITDDLSMTAITDYTLSAAAAVDAILAGNDLLCCTDYTEQIPAVLNAVADGTISMQRVEESVMRILKWKYQLGLLEIDI